MASETPTVKLSRAAKRGFKLDRLCQAARDDRLALTPYRNNRKKMIRLDAGSLFGEYASELDRPYNGIGLYRMIVKRALVNQTPRMMLTTWKRESRRKVKTAQDWCNRQCEKMHLGEQLERWVDDALFWMGFMKCGIVTPVDAERTGYRTFAGEAFAECIDPDDVGFDMQARTWEEMTYFMHRYRASVDAANQFHKLRGDNKLTQTGQLVNQEGDERVGVIGRGYISSDRNEFTERCDLWECWLPGPRMLLTFRSQESGVPGGEDDLLEVREYYGPMDGPITPLTYINIPGQIAGKGPIADQVPLDLAINNMFRKLIRQAKRFKQNNCYAGAAAEDMARLNAAGDGDDVKIDRLGDIKQFSSMPPNPQLFALAQAFKQLHSMIAGNLEVMGGLARQAGTAAQESQMNQNANATLAMLQQVTTRQTSRVMRKLGQYWWDDPQGVMQITKTLDSAPEYEWNEETRPAGTTNEYGQPHPDARDLEWDEIDAKVDPYSLSTDTPQSRVQHIRTLINTYAPLQQFMQQQGVIIDYKYAIKKEAEYSNNPDVEDLFGLGEPTPGEEDGEKPGLPQNTERTYTRKSESEATNAGQTEDMVQKMMGAGAPQAGDFGGMQ